MSLADNQQFNIWSSHGISRGTPWKSFGIKQKSNNKQTRIYLENDVVVETIDTLETGITDWNVIHNMVVDIQNHYQNFLSNAYFYSPVYNGKFCLLVKNYNRTDPDNISVEYTFLTNWYTQAFELEMTNKNAYLASFPTNVQEGEYEEISCNLLNIIASNLSNLSYYFNFKPSEQIDFSELVDVLSSIGEILHDKELTQPILINQNNTENFASLENEDWNLNNDEY